MSLPTKVLDEALVRSGAAPSLSAYVSLALATQVAAESQQDEYLGFLDALDEELGPPTEDDYAWARRGLNIDRDNSPSP